jgi:hypothetical protein
MIGKIAIGKSFKGCLLYCLNDKLQEQKQELVMKNRAEILLFNQCYGNQKELIQQFNEVRWLNPKLSKPVLHITLSLAQGEQLPKDKLMEICQDCAKDMGFENNQYIAIHHRDTNHQHLHIVANRVGYDKRTVSDSKNFQKIAAYCRKMELKFQLKQVLSPRQFLSKELRLIPRQDVRKEQLKRDIQQTLKQARNYDEFEQKMNSLGYQVLKGRGISFIDDKKVKIKGSEAGFSLMKIEKILALKQELSIKETLKQNQPKLSPKQQYEYMRKPLSAGEKIIPERDTFNDYETMPTIELQKQIAELITQVMKPEQIPEQLAPELLRKLKQKKRHRHHL